MEYLKVHQFGPIGDIDITLKKVNIFIGEQGVGKSTLAKLLSCCRDYFIYYLILHEKDRSLISQVFSSYGIHTYFKPETRIEYSNQEGWHLCYSKGNFTIENREYTSDETVKKSIQLVMDGIRFPRSSVAEQQLMVEFFDRNLIELSFDNTKTFH